MKNWAKSQLIGTGVITAILGIVVGALAIYESAASAHKEVLNLEGDGRQGVFVVWLVFVIIFLVINTIFYAARGTKHSK